jgi:hypothetical protein
MLERMRARLLSRGEGTRVGHENEMGHKRKAGGKAKKGRTILARRPSSASLAVR